MVVNEVPTNEVQQAGGERISRQPVRVTSRLVATGTFGPERTFAGAARSLKPVIDGRLGREHLRRADEHPFYKGSTRSLPRCRRSGNIAIASPPPPGEMLQD